MNILYFRFANSFLEPMWNRNYIASVQVSLCESFGVEDRGAFYETAGCLRDVIQNHLFQIVALLAMEPPPYRGFGAVHAETAEVLQAMRPIQRSGMSSSGRSYSDGCRDKCMIEMVTISPAGTLRPASSSSTVVRRASLDTGGCRRSASRKIASE